MSGEPSSGSDEAALRELLLQLGAAGLAAGRPVHEVEREVAAVAHVLDAPRAQSAATPTGIFVSLSPGQPAGFAAVGPPLRFDQAARLAAVERDLRHARLGIAGGLRALREIPETPPRVSRRAAAAAYVPMAAGVALILQPTVASVAVASVAAVVLATLDLLADRARLVRVLLPVLAAFGSGCVVFLAAELGLLDAPLRTVLASIAPLLPGALIVTSMSELAHGAMVAGTARLTYGAVQLLLLTSGILLAARAVGLESDTLANIRLDDLGPVATVAGLLLVGAGVYFNLNAPRRVLPWMLAGLVASAAVQALGQEIAGPAFGGFAGGLCAALLAGLVHRLPDGPPALLVFLPAFWLLVPGSLGVASATEIAASGAADHTLIVGAIAPILALALGVLVGTALGDAPSRRR